MRVGPWSVGAQLDSSLELLSGVELWVEDPLSVGQVNVRSDSKGSFVEKFDLLLSELSVQNVEVLHQGLQVGSEQVVIQMHLVENNRVTSFSFTYEDIVS